MLVLSVYIPLGKHNKNNKKQNGGEEEKKSQPKTQEDLKLKKKK